jgi:hypothetical protein
MLKKVNNKKVIASLLWRSSYDVVSLDKQEGMIKEMSPDISLR